MRSMRRSMGNKREHLHCKFVLCVSLIILKHARKQNVYEFSSDTIISALHIPTTSS